MYDQWFEERLIKASQTQPDEANTDDPTEIQALKNLLHGLTTAKVAAKNFTSSVRDKFDSKTNNDQWDLLWSPWGLILDAAQEIPSAQDRIVELLQAIKDLEDSKSGDAVLRWRDLPYLGAMFDDAWKSQSAWLKPPSDPESGPQRQKYISLNAFGSRLTTSGTLDLKMHGLWSLRRALEEEPWKDNHPAPIPEAEKERHHYQHSIQFLNDLLPAAAPWIFIAGNLYFHSDDNYEQTPQGGDPARGGKLWTGKHGLCKERWAFWKERMRGMESEEELEDGTRKIAAEVVGKMMGIERL